MTLDELIDFNIEVKELEQVVRNTNEETSKQVDWTQLWAEKYPILSSYQQEVKTNDYVLPLKELLQKLSIEYGYSDLDSFLVLKDILAGILTKK